MSDRFWAKVDQRGPDECWPWLAYRDANGYGRFSIGGRAGRMESAHRVAYELTNGPIPKATEVDHLCRTHACVNPAHLEAVPHRVNCERGVAAEINRARQLAVSRCPKGHPYDEENTGRRADGRRRCRACDRARARASYRPRRAA